MTDETRETQVALRHFAYFPGTALAAAAWRTLPAPLDDARFLVLLATLLCGGACLLFAGPLTVRVAVGAAIAANPLAIRAAWFGTADAPSLLLVIVSFALVTRSSYLVAGAALGGAVLLKQFALVAIPFLAAMIWTRTATVERCSVPEPPRSPCSPRECCHSSSPIPARCGATRSPTGPTATASWGTGSRRCW